MSLLNALTKRATLDAAVKQVAKARKNEGSAAEQLYLGAYQGFAKVLADNPVIADALYHWGFALLHEGKSQTEAQAVAAFKEAIEKFSFCLVTAPHYLGAAIDGGVAFMELARISPEKDKDELYGKAKAFFDKANAIQKGSASYNLACIYALRGDDEACLNALEEAKAHGSLPDKANVLQDVDLTHVLEKSWFKTFIASLNTQPSHEAESASEAEKESLDPYDGAKLVKKDTFDYYQ